MARPVHKTRYENLSKQIERFERDEPGKAVMRRFSERIGISPSALSQVRTGVRNVGPDLARRLETAFNLERGWIDREHKEWEPLNGGEAFYLTTAIAVFRAATTEEQHAMIQELLNKQRREHR